MRVWHLGPSYIDDRRLLAVNTELHTLLSCIRSGSTAWAGVVSKYCKSVHYLKACHDSAARELELRAWNRGVEEPVHPSPFIISDLSPDLISTDLVISNEDLRKDVVDIRAKWNREGYFYGMGRISLHELEIQLGIPPGITSGQAEKKKEEIRQLVKTHAWWFREYRLRNPKSRMQDRIDAFFNEQEKIREARQSVK